MPVPAPTPTFAKPVLEFGSKGIGAGQFKDARTITVDNEGRIYVGEYTGGRVQVFDSRGKFITQWMVDPKSALFALAADRKGTIYVVHPNQLVMYEAATGKLLGDVRKLAPHHYEYYRDLFVALDGSLYAVSSDSSIVHMSSDGQIEDTIKSSEKIGESVNFERVVVSGAGDIYALERSKGIFKFGPDGRYINRFGGEGNGPGEFSSANSLAVDGAGRIYVSDSGRPVHVFDGNGHYLDSFGESDVVFGLAINDQNEIFAMHRNQNKVIKYVLSKR
jgi:sugar lactone lactonase YvrE